LELRPFRFIRNLGRSREIATVLLMHGFGDLVDRLNLGRYLRWGKRFFLRRKQEPDIHRTRGERIRLALETLGPTFIKFGQVMSTRPDLIPADVINELSHLQERVPPFPFEAVEQSLHAQFGAPISQVFAAFERQPIAAGSLGQVHRAEHHNGTILAVKVRRPNCVRDVERDLALMQELAVLIERHIPEAQIFDPIGMVSQFARTIRRELNFQREGRTTDEFSRLFRSDATLRVPDVYFDLTTESVLTLQFIEGWRIDQVEQFRAGGIAAEEIAANGARIFMKQAFELGIFHGDPHPGNIRILPDGTICLLDYGMIGMLEEEQREQLVDLIIAISRQDVRSAVEIIQKVGRPLRTVDAPLLRADVRDFVENYYGLELDRLNVGNMLTDLVAILSSHGIRCPSDLMLLIRALVTLEGVGRDLDPNFNMAAHLAPFVEKLVRDRFNPSHMARRLASESRTYFRLAREVPVHIGRSLEKLSKDDLKLQFEHRGLDHLITEIDRSSNRLVIGLVLAALIVASALVIRTGSGGLWLSVPIFLLSSFLGIWLIYGVFRSGRL
jgi:ubiquinone biosynthesis protein